MRTVEIAAVERAKTILRVEVPDHWTIVDVENAFWDFEDFYRWCRQELERSREDPSLPHDHEPLSTDWEILGFREVEGASALPELAPLFVEDAL